MPCPLLLRHQPDDLTCLRNQIMRADLGFRIA